MTNEELQGLEPTTKTTPELTSQKNTDNRVAFLRIKIGGDPNKASNSIETTVDFVNQDNEFSIDESITIEELS